MQPEIKKLFDDLLSQKREAEDELARLEDGDDTGMVLISTSGEGLSYGAERITKLKADRIATLSLIEAHLAELEQAAGVKRPR